MYKLTIFGVKNIRYPCRTCTCTQNTLIEQSLNHSGSKLVDFINSLVNRFKGVQVPPYMISGDADVTVLDPWGSTEQSRLFYVHIELDPKKNLITLL